MPQEADQRFAKRWRREERLRCASALSLLRQPGSRVAGRRQSLRRGLLLSRILERADCPLDRLIDVVVFLERCVIRPIWSRRDPSPRSSKASSGCYSRRRDHILKQIVRNLPGRHRTVHYSTGQFIKQRYRTSEERPKTVYRTAFEMKAFSAGSPLGPPVHCISDKA